MYHNTAIITQHLAEFGSESSKFVLTNSVNLVVKLGV